MKKLFLIYITLIGIFFSAGGQTHRKPTVAIMYLWPTAISEEQARFLTDRLVIEIQKTGEFEILESKKLYEVLKKKGFKRSKDYDNISYLLEVGHLLPVEKIIGGSIGRIGSIFSVQLRIIDIKTGKVERASNSDFSGSIEQLLTRGIKEAVGGLFGFEAQDNISNDEEEPLLLDEFPKQGQQYVKVDSILKARGLKPVFQDSFDKMKNWEIFSGDWRLENGTLCGRAANSNIYIKYKSIFPNEGAVRCKFKSAGDYGAGILFKVSGENQEGICVHYFSGRKQLSIYPIYYLMLTTGEREIEYTVSSKEWNDITVIFKDSQLTVILNDLLMYEGQMEMHNSGPFYLCTGLGNTACFDDFIIYK